jgi:hypothetical protein
MLNPILLEMGAAAMDVLERASIKADFGIVPQDKLLDIKELAAQLEAVPVESE